MATEAAIGMTQCTLLVSLDLMVSVSTGPVGWFQIGVPVAAEAGLAGGKVHAPFGTRDACANPGRIPVTNGPALVLGS